VNPLRRVMALFVVLLALFQGLPLAVEAWQTGQWPEAPLGWLRLALLPAALWLYLRHFSVVACRRCAADDERGTP
jgi:hypothetical protein